MVGRGSFSHSGQARGSERVPGGPRAGGVNDGCGLVVADFAVGVFDPDHEGGGVAVPAVGLVHALPGHCHDADAGVQSGRDRRERGEWAEVLVDEVPAGGQRRRLG